MVVFPEKTILYFFMVTMFLTAYIVRIFEIPHADSGFQSFFTSLWWTVITMTTIGYGDISPVTPPGQLMTMMFAIWHSILFSLLVVVCSNIFNLKEN